MIPTEEGRVVGGWALEKKSGWVVWEKSDYPPHLGVNLLSSFPLCLSLDSFRERLQAVFNVIVRRPLQKVQLSKVFLSTSFFVAWFYFFGGISGE